MRLFHKISLIISVFSISLSFGQNISPAPCATQITPEVRAWFHSLDHDRRKIFRIQNQELYVPVVIHLVGNDQGFGFFPKDMAYQLICELNRHFIPVHMRFFLADTIHYIADDQYYVHDWNNGYNMMNIYNVDDVMNVYVVQDPAEACGYAYYPGGGPNHGRGGIALAKSCARPDNSTFPHEVGHYFSLPHTFDQWNSGNAEYVDGSNCSNAGDYFCDTPADFLDFRWNCPYTGNQTDPQGDPYQPDGTFFMSYSIEPCANHFSLEQMNAMVASRLNDRPYLDNTPPPSFSPKTLVNLIEPPDNSHVPVSGFMLRWNSVPGAIEYTGALTEANSFNLAALKFSTQDTFYMINQNLGNAKNFKWKISAMTPYYPCSDADSLQGSSHFRTDISLSQAELSTENIRIYPVPSGVHSAISSNNPAVLAGSVLTVTDLNGKIILKKNLISGSDPVLIESGELQAGYYLLTFTRGDSFRFTHQIILY